MARAIGVPSRAPAWVAARLRAGEKIMGLGHREYRVTDPRAAILKPMARTLCERKGLSSIVETLLAVEEHAGRRLAARGRAVHANVDFYKGAALAALAIPPDCFTAVFAMSRVYGWGAHVLELWEDHKLYRPRARYVGAGARRWPDSR
jgi:citrate synthase